MNKSELAAAVAARAGIPAKAARDAVGAVFEEIEDRLADGDEVSIVGFGVFDTVERSARNARNIQTGEIVRIGPRRVARFKAGKRLKKRAAGEILPRE